MEQDHDKIIRLEEKIDAATKVIDEIKNNHLVHLSNDVKELSKSIGNINVKLGMWSGGIVVVIWILERFIK